MDKTAELTMALMARPSMTPNDEGCQDLMVERLSPLGFEIERLRFGEVDNFWAQRGQTAPLVVFAGHTDVVPTGPRDMWDSDPFVPEVRDGHIFGRGAADMKASLAAFVVAIEKFIKQHPQHEGSIGLLITSDEEGIASDGTVKVVDWLNRQGKKIDYCIVGEPTSVSAIGDTIKVGRRGSLNGTLTVHGVQGHVAYPDLASNPIHAVAPVLAELVDTEWDRGTADFPPTSFQISNIHGGTGADNVIPSTLEILFNFRYSPAVTTAELCRRVEASLRRHDIEYRLDWRRSGEPFWTGNGPLLEAICSAVQTELGVTPQRATTGGTSDGRFIAPMGAEVVELGPINKTVHQANECVRLQDLPRLVQVYTKTLELLLVEKD
ncbi:MAG: succinyl-diaminopimelate desuccinylase [Gammaproteobacteria bacterium]|nr:succinyl-diaminopimelate desuccinylase [Gammaproteobacteria bacterium]